jgi:hypothetical protein
MAKRLQFGIRHVDGEVTVKLCRARLARRVESQDSHGSFLQCCGASRGLLLDMSFLDRLAGAAGQRQPSDRLPSAAAMSQAAAAAAGARSRGTRFLFVLGAFF